MIYIIDEKTKRQTSYGWDARRFQKYYEVITPINDYSFLGSEGFEDDILSAGNVVLFHESFFNGIAEDKKGIAKDFLRKLDIFGQIGVVVYYGGSKSSRKINGNVAFLPVSVMYQHLETYLNRTKDGVDDINYLIWGENPLIEKYIIEEIANANEKMLDDLDGYNDVTNKSLVIISSDKNQLYIPDTNQNITIKELFPENEKDEPISDNLLHSYVLSWLQEREYDSIVLPLCFGPVLSDYNGLRLALHIRCTQTQNQLKPIYLYGVVGYSYLINNEYFDVLRTKEVYLVSYDNKSILSSLTDTHQPIGPELLGNELKKVRLNLPENYIDSHSIANEWAIYRWAKTIDAADADIDRVVKNVETNLYFKYLNTIYPISPLNQLKRNDLIIPTNGNEKPKVLLVDDEAEKGWYEIFCTILDDVNGFYFDHLDEEFNEKSSDEIVQIVHDKIVEDDIDIVVLDYRLHKTDFFASSITEVTGYKVLKDIKTYLNKGIQVIVLSATSKIWNWEELKKAGADGFIMKDNPETNLQDLSTVNNIKKFIHVFGEIYDRTFLKQFYSDLSSLKEYLLPRKNKKSERPLLKEFVDEVLKWYELSCEILSVSINEHTTAASYLFLFSVLENLTNQIINEVPAEFQYDSGKLVYRYKFRLKDEYLRRFVDETATKTRNYVEVDNPWEKPKWAQKIYNTLDYLSSLDTTIDYRHLVSIRNDFIHPNSIENSCEKKKIEIGRNDLISLHNVVTIGLKSI
jgi:CheY-like chemotaxis protein